MFSISIISLILVSCYYFFFIVPQLSTDFKFKVKSFPQECAKYLIFHLSDIIEEKILEINSNYELLGGTVSEILVQ